MQYFVAACRSGSISRAAAALHVTQPAVSQQIRKLERELRTELFVRRGHALRLTRAGARLLPCAERALDAISQGLSEVREISERTVTVGSPHSFETVLLPRILRAFASEHPEIEVTVRENHETEGFEDLLRQGELDLALKAVRSGEAGNNVGDIEVRILGEDPIVLVLPPGHRLADRQSVALREVAGEPFIALNASGTVRYLPLLCGEASFRPEIVFETSHSDVLMEMVRAGRGLAVSPMMAVTPGMSWVTIDSPQAIRQVGLLWCRDPLPPRAALAFADYLIEATSASSAARHIT